MQKKTEESTITVPIPNHSEIRIGTLLSIIRQSGLPRELFENEFTESASSAAGTLKEC